MVHSGYHPLKHRPLRIVLGPSIPVIMWRMIFNGFGICYMVNVCVCVCVCVLSCYLSPVVSALSSLGYYVPQVNVCVCVWCVCVWCSAIN